MKENLINHDQASNIARQYILNCNPTTGEILEESNRLEPLLLKSLEALINPSIDDLKKLMNKKCGYPSRRGFSWSYQEDKKLIDNFHKNYSVEDMAEEHERSITAISARLKHHKLIDEDIAFPQYKNKKQFSIYI